MKLITFLSFILCFLFSSTSSFAQQVSTEWTKRYQGVGQLPQEAKALAVDDSGNVYVTGYSFTTNSGEGKDFMTLKYNAAGTLIWQRGHDGPYGRDDMASGIAVDPWGDIIVTGQTLDSYVHHTITAIKYDPAGNVRWTATYAPEGVSGSIAVAMTMDSLGNTYVTGTGDTTGVDKDFITVKFDSAGNMVWNQRYDGTQGYDRSQAISLDKWLNVYVTGWSDGFTAVKYNASGDEQWVRKWYGSQGSIRSESLTVDDSGNVYLVGHRGIIAGFTDPGDMVTAKYNTDGVLQWTQTYAGPNESADQGYYIEADKWGNVYAFGRTESSPTSGSEYLLVKYNSLGVQLWTEVYAPATCLDCRDEAQGLFIDAEGNVYISGSSHIDDYPFSDYITAKYSPDGTQQWVETLNGLADDIPQDIYVDNQGYVYVTGKSQGSSTTTDWDYLTAKYKQTPAPSTATSVNKTISRLSTHPSPASNHSTITYSLEKKATVHLQLYDAIGRRIRVLASGQELPGLHEVPVDVSELPEGIYLYSLTADGEIATEKLQVLK